MSEVAHKFESEPVSVRHARAHVMQRARKWCSMSRVYEAPESRTSVTIRGYSLEESATAQSLVNAAVVKCEATLVLAFRSCIGQWAKAFAVLHRRPC